MAELNDKSRTRKSLSDVLHLYTTRTEDPLAFAYEIECTSLSQVAFTLNFQGTENFNIMAATGSGATLEDMKLTVKVAPYHRAHLGQVIMIDEDRRASLKMSCAWAMEEADASAVEDYMKVQDAQLQQSLTEATKLNFPHHMDDPTLERVHEICRTYGKSFVDFEFAPTTTSLYKTSTLNSNQNVQKIEWKRPKDFLKNQYEVFEGAIEAADIRQGALGDCWFLSAVAALTEFESLVIDIFTPASRKTNESGVYTLRFCKMGIWQTVRVDDFFPCYPAAGPIYSRSNGDELWVLLIEKAYAKVHGCYEAIRAGYAYEGMIDLTGCPSKTIRFDDPIIQHRISTGDLWTDLLRYDEENFIMSASTPGEDSVTEHGRFAKSSTGLIAGHAYTLISAVRISRGDRLIKLRNPWGQLEWNGKWADDSSDWTPEIQAEILTMLPDHKFEQADDGIFWMSFEDVVKHFFSINVCLVRHPEFNKKPWKDARRPFHFDLEEVLVDEPTTSDTARIHAYRVLTPCYVLTVAEKGFVVATVHQQDTRCVDSPPYIDIGVAILQVDPTYGTFKLVAGAGNSADRQNQTEELELEAGKYLVIPTTSGGKLRQQIESTRKERNTVANPSKPMVALTKTNPANDEIEFADIVVQAYTELFQRMNVNNDGYLSKLEVDQYMLRTEGATIEEVAYKWLLHTFQNTPDATGLSLSAFLRVQQHVFQLGGYDEDKLWTEMKTLGYDEYMHLRNCRSATMVVHCTADFKLETLPHDENAYQEAQELVCREQGECQSFEDGKIKLYKLRAGFAGITLMVENNAYVPLVFSLDCAESENVMSNRGELIHEETIAPQKRAIMHHLMPANPAITTWSWSYSASYMFLED